MNTYFIRHNTGMDIDDDTRRRLWEERRIAIHFPWGRTGKNTKDISSIDPDDYVGSAKRCVRALVDLARAGGYVCAQHHPYTQCMLGFVRPHSKVELFKGKWGDRNDRQGRTAVLKTLRLSKVRLVEPLDFAILHIGRPRQGTIMRWHLAGKTVENLVEGRRVRPQLSDLSHDQQEILCSEFLRLPKAEKLGLPGLAHLIVPTGRTRPDIDIDGITTDGKRLLAQVTFAPLPSVMWKIDRLLPYRDPKRAHLLLFCDCTDQTKEDGVTIFPIQKAYDIFTSTRLGRIWLRRSARRGLTKRSTEQPRATVRADASWLVSAGFAASAFIP